MELDGWVEWEGLEEDKRSETLIRLYYMKKPIFDQIQFDLDLNKLPCLQTIEML